MRTRSAADARPVRTVLNSVRACSTDFPIRVCASVISSSTVAMSLLLRGLDDGADFLAAHDPGDVGYGELEHVYRQLVVHAERKRCRVHHLQAALDCLEVREPRQELRIGIGLRIAAVHAFNAVLR